jgi:hypothetical protein
MNEGLSHVTKCKHLEEKADGHQRVNARFIGTNRREFFFNLFLGWHM